MRGLAMRNSGLSDLNISDIICDANDELAFSASADVRSKVFIDLRIQVQRIILDRVFLNTIDELRK